MENLPNLLFPKPVLKGITDPGNYVRILISQKNRLENEKNRAHQKGSLFLSAFLSR